MHRKNLLDPFPQFIRNLKLALDAIYEYGMLFDLLERFGHPCYPAEIAGVCQVLLGAERRIHHRIGHRFAVKLLVKLLYRRPEALLVTGIAAQRFHP